MGVRFACHACGKRLNIKNELAGRQGVCPACSVRFRIPTEDRPQSIAIEEESSASHPADVPDEQDQNDVLDSSDQTPSGDVADSDSESSASTYAATAAGGPTTIERPKVEKKTKPTPEKKPAAPASAEPTTPEEILGDSTAVWYVRPPSGGQYGPADGPTMKQWITEGRIADSAMLWRDGWPDWKTAGEILRQLNHKGSTSAAQPGPKPILATPGNAHLVDSRLVDAPADRDKVAILNRGGPLESSKRKRSRKRIAATVSLILLLVVLVAALAYVITR
ncbi:DUF4339 domain-containing protein [Rhodopirellula europaea]|uniref:GYF domain-containing protein n=1 Tax=Rhodopirellula europaea 6C TaxID=1263867 RepID=M2B4D9_9BACT|nr:DUF4339 domain-containing protein [Rhodopirellula europaea]EMB17064.1 hypothetical protein RE6C_02215 [Rhodopirellula europaea 6C]